MKRGGFEFLLKNLLAWLMVRVLAGPVATKALEPFTRRRVRHLGLEIATDHPAFSPRTRAQMFWGMYERPEVNFLKRYLAGASEVIELGSGLGVTGAHLVSAMSRGGRLLCVEANPLSVSALKATLSRRAGMAGIELEILESTIHEGDAPVSIAFDGDLLATRLVAAGPRRGVPHGKTITLAEVAGRRSEGYALVSDIEGAEASFILGDEESLRSCDRMVIELHDTEWNGRQVTREDLVKALIARHGFTLLASKGPVFVLTR